MSGEMRRLGEIAGAAGRGLLAETGLGGAAATAAHFGARRDDGPPSAASNAMLEVLRTVTRSMS